MLISYKPFSSCVKVEKHLNFILTGFEVGNMNCMQFNAYSNSVNTVLPLILFSLCKILI